MSGALLDTSVLLDVVTDDPTWASWSQQQMEALALKGPLFINAVVYAEVSIGYRRIEELEAVLAAIAVKLLEIPRPALFLAGKVFRAYRRKGGRKSGVLPDFFIGAHAAVAGLPLLSRDTGRYRANFPTLQLIAPKGPQGRGNG